MSGRWVWVVAVVSIALLAFAPVGWIQAARETVSLPGQLGSHTAQAQDLGPGTSIPTEVSGDDGDTPSVSCGPTATATATSPPLPTATATSPPTSTPTSTPLPLPTSTPTREPSNPSITGNSGVPAAPPAAQSALSQTFRLCGRPDLRTQQSIERLIAGRSFSAKLVSRSDGCADLSITISPGSTSGPSSGRQSTSLSVSAGSGGTTHRISIQIVSQNGATHVTIG